MANQSLNEHTKRVVAAARREIAGKRFTVGSPLHLLEMFIQIVEERSSDETRAHDPIFEGLVTSFGAAISAWTTGSGTREQARVARDALCAHFHFYAVDVAKAQKLKIERLQRELHELRESSVKASGD